MGKGAYSGCGRSRLVYVSFLHITIYILSFILHPLSEIPSGSLGWPLNTHQKSIVWPDRVHSKQHVFNRISSTCGKLQRSLFLVTEFHVCTDMRCRNCSFQSLTSFYNESVVKPNGCQSIVFLQVLYYTITLKGVMNCLYSVMISHSLGYIHLCFLLGFWPSLYSKTWQ